MLTNSINKLIKTLKLNDEKSKHLLQMNTLNNLTRNKGIHEAEVQH